MQSSNPNAMLQNLMLTNPQIKQAAEMISSQYNGDGQAAFYAAARAKGMSDQQIEEFLKAIK